MRNPKYRTKETRNERSRSAEVNPDGGVIKHATGKKHARLITSLGATNDLCARNATAWAATLAMHRGRNELHRFATPNCVAFCPPASTRSSTAFPAPRSKLDWS